ncbi:MAG: HNH endonuclease [Chloroflexi bacterium]|nr:HNH endonuclease [Chloroflexota bacterium]
MRVSSNEGDVVLDPFCGCATTCIAAERLDRQWIGIDLSALAVRLVEQRAGNKLGLMGGIQAIARSDVPKRTDREPAPPLSESRVVLYGTQGGNCNGCGTHFLPQHLTVDHIIARSKGGTNHLDNLQLLCGHCNSLKGDRPMEYLRARLVRDYV